MASTIKSAVLSLALVSTLGACKNGASDSEVKGLDENAGPYFHEMTYLTSHNAFVNREDKMWAVSNQGSVSLKDQLRRGARGLMLDAYNQDNKAILCHSSCANVPGVFPTQSMTTALKEVASFLRENRNEIVTLHIEDYLDQHAPGLVETIASKTPFGKLFGKSNPDAEGTFNKALTESGLKDFIFNPYKEGVRDHGWPKVNKMINSNKRLLILSSRKYSDNLGVAFDQDFTVENYWSIGGITSTDLTCKSRWGIPLNKKGERFERLFVMNHFRDIANVIQISKDNKFDAIMSRVEKNCLSVAGRKPNYIALDRAVEGGGLDVVKKLNQVKGIAYADSDFNGKAQLLFPGDLRVDKLTIGNDAISSIRILNGGQITLFGDDNYKAEIKKISSSQKYVGDEANDKISSLKVH